MKLIVLFLLGFTINAQNLVPNPSFDSYSLCPDNIGQISRAFPWIRMYGQAGTPDFFHACNPIPYVGVPTNTSGTQAAFEGNGYAGIYTYLNSESYREYIFTQLTTPLTAGQTYFVSFYVSSAENFKFASNKMGVMLTSDLIAAPGGSGSVNIIPNIWSETVITNTTGWTLISGTYHAMGGEQYITIGNFHSDSATQTVVTNPNVTNAFFQGAYYYIDQVIVSATQMGNSQFHVQKTTVTPNPVTDVFVFNGEENEIINKIELYNQYSKVKVFNHVENRIDIQELPSGIYYLIVTYESKKRTSTKLIKL